MESTDHFEVASNTSMGGGMHVDYESFDNQPKNPRNIPKLPFGVRCVIYSYLDLMTLINVISKLSKQERTQIPHSEVLDQPRCLKIYIKQGKMIQFPQLEYCTKLSSSFELCIEKMQEQDIFIYQTVLHMISIQKKQVSVAIGLNDQISTKCFAYAQMEQHRDLVKTLELKLYDQCDHLIPELCKNFSFVPKLEINLNNYALNFDNLPQS